MYTKKFHDGFTWYDGIVGNDHSSEAINLILKRSRHIGFSLNELRHNGDVLAYETAYLKNKMTYGKLKSSAFFQAFKREFDAFLKDGVLPGDCRFIDDSQREYSMQDLPKSNYRYVLKVPFKPEWDKGGRCNIKNGLMVRVGNFHGSDGDASTLVETALPCGFRELTPEEKECFTIIVAEAYPRLFKNDIYFFDTEVTKDRLFGKQEKVRFLNYRCLLVWDPKPKDNPIAQEKSSAPPKPLKDLY